MSLCTTMKFSALALGAAGLDGAVTNAIQQLPPDVLAVANQLIAAWEKGGLIGILCVIVVALWIDSKREQKAAAEYRERREKMESEKMEAADARSAHVAEKIAELSTVLRENSVRCEVTRQAMEKQAHK